MKPSFLISGTHSGVGKTTVSFILMSLFTGMGYQVQPFKHGPDFIDPGYHRFATGRDSINLDFWMMEKEHIMDSFIQYTQDADLGIVEAMGALFDGQNGTERGSAAQLASLLHLPIILVVDVYGMTRSVNALLQGFLDFDPQVNIAGVIFNRAGSKKHYEMIFDSLLPHFRNLSLGYLPRFHATIPERHLGLLTVEENTHMTKISEMYVKTAQETLKHQALLDSLTIVREDHPKVLPKLSSSMGNLRKLSPQVRLGVAKDQAFCFYYRQNLHLLEEAGAELVYFSPLKNTELPKSLDGLYFGGGYPENFAKQLEENITLRSQILSYAQSGMPIYGECGGLIYLCEKLLCGEGNVYAMVGVFPYTILWDKNYLAIRYIEVKTTRDTLLGPKGLVIKGQEFHQTRFIDTSELDYCYEVASSVNERFLEGYQAKNTLASYVHLYFPSAKNIPHDFVSQCKKYQQEKYAYSSMSDL